MMIHVLIPVFDEATALSRLLPTMPEHVCGLPVRPLVISDGSTDATPAVATAHGVPVLELWPNRGKGAALRAGMEAVQSAPKACVVFMDGDGQHLPGELANLVAPVLAGTCDIAWGSRYLVDRGRGPTPLNRFVVRQLAVWSLRRRLDTHLTDPFCGYHALAPSVAATWRPSGNDYQGELELLFDASIEGWALREVAVTRSYDGPCSKMGATRGPLRGRIHVMQQYAATIARKSAELTSARRQRRADPRARSNHA